MTDLHCPQCQTRITPYEHEMNDKATKGNVINACWHCGLPMSDVLAKNAQGVRELPAPRVTLSQAEKELAELRAELARMKAEVPAAPPEPQPTSQEYGEGWPLVVAAPPRPRMPSETEAAEMRRGPGRPPLKR